MALQMQDKPVSKWKTAIPPAPCTCTSHNPFITDTLCSTLAVNLTAFSVGSHGRCAAKPTTCQGRPSHSSYDKVKPDIEAKSPPATKLETVDCRIHTVSCWWYLAVDGVFDADRHPIEQTQLLWLCFPELGLTLLQILRDAIGFCGDLESLGDSSQSPQVRHSPQRCARAFCFAKDICLFPLSHLPISAAGIRAALSVPFQDIFLPNSKTLSGHRGPIAPAGA